jgi:hypothetical protein
MNADEFDDWDERPRNGKKKKAKGGSKVLLFVGLGVGAVLLLFCCAGVGVSVWLLVNSGPMPGDLVGKWEQTRVVTKFGGNEMAVDIRGAFYEFHRDGTYTAGMTGGLAGNGNCKITSQKDKAYTVELWTADNKTKLDTFNITVVDRDRLNFVNTKAPETTIELVRVR